MTDVINIAMLGLMVVAVAPLLLIGFLLLSLHLNWRLADRIVRVAVLALEVQWIVAALVNLVGGVGLAGLGLWILQRSAPWPVEVAIIPLGLWRAWKGANLLRECLLARRSAPDQRR